MQRAEHHRASAARRAAGLLPPIPALPAHVRLQPHSGAQLKTASQPGAAASMRLGAAPALPCSNRCTHTLLQCGIELGPVAAQEEQFKPHKQRRQCKRLHTSSVGTHAFGIWCVRKGGRERGGLQACNTQPYAGRRSPESALLPFPAAPRPSWLYTTPCQGSTPRTTHPLLLPTHPPHPPAQRC